MLNQSEYPAYFDKCEIAKSCCDLADYQFPVTPNQLGQGEAIISHGLLRPGVSQ